MKRLVILTILLTGLLAANSQSTEAGLETLQLKETAHDFGKIPQHRPVYHYFEIINTGTTPLKLDNIHASCGCTTPEWDKEAIAPGATAQVKVGFNAAAEGPFTKDIIITYNGNQTRKMTITGKVWKAPEGAAPANPSVQFSKKQTL